MLNNLPTGARAAILFSLLAGSQAVVAAGLAFGWSAGAILTAGITLVVLAGVLFVLSLKMVRTIVGDFTRHTREMGKGNLATEIRITGNKAEAEVKLVEPEKTAPAPGTPFAFQANPVSVDSQPFLMHMDQGVDLTPKKTPAKGKGKVAPKAKAKRK